MSGARKRSVRLTVGGQIGVASQKKGVAAIFSLQHITITYDSTQKHGNVTKASRVALTHICEDVHYISSTLVARLLLPETRPQGTIWTNTRIGTSREPFQKLNF